MERPSPISTKINPFINNLQTNVSNSTYHQKKKKEKNKRRLLITLIKFFTDQTQKADPKEPLEEGTVGRKNKIPLVPPKLKLD